MTSLLRSAAGARSGGGRDAGRVTATAGPPIPDHECRRRERETVNEWVVSAIVSIVAAAILTTETMWTALAAGHALRSPADFTVPPPVRMVTAAILVTHLALLLVLVLERRYVAWRKHAIVAMRMALFGALAWAEWFNPRRDFGLLLPIPLFAVAIVLAALSYSRGAVLLAGALACLVYGPVSLSGPAAPENLKATLFATALFLAATAVTYRLVSSMLVMSAEAVSNERLSRFFSPDIAARIAAEPQLAVRGTACRVSVLFSDISGFTAISGTMSPEEVVNLLNAYFPRMVEIVFRHGGTLEKFIGDALLAVWGAPVDRPDDADRAVAAALEMQAAVSRFNAERQAAGRPEIAIHIGIASGPAAAGYIGTAQYVQYAVIGDTTNVAARICTAAGPREILVSDETRGRHSGRGVVFEAVPAIAARGKDAPIAVHRVGPGVPDGTSDGSG